MLFRLMLAQWPPWSGRVDEVADYFLTYKGFWVSVPVVLGLCAGVLMLGWAWRTLRRASGAKRRV